MKGKKGSFEIKLKIEPFAWIKFKSRTSMIVFCSTHVSQTSTKNSTCQSNSNQLEGTSNDFLLYQENPADMEDHCPFFFFSSEKITSPTESPYGKSTLRDSGSSSHQQQQGRKVNPLRIPSAWISNEDKVPTPLL